MVDVQKLWTLATSVPNMDLFFFLRIPCARASVPGASALVQVGARASVLVQVRSCKYARASSLASFRKNPLQCFREELSYT